MTPQDIEAGRRERTTQMILLADLMATGHRADAAPVQAQIDAQYQAMTELRPVSAEEYRAVGRSCVDNSAWRAVRGDRTGPGRVPARCRRGVCHSPARLTAFRAVPRDQPGKQLLRRTNRRTSPGLSLPSEVLPAIVTIESRPNECLPKRLTGPPMGIRHDHSRRSPGPWAW